ncbi:MAG: succinate dehydrogenase iron-sulfur subunit, partial [Myxococcaceae bacterium]
METTSRTVRFQIVRQDAPDAPERVESFDVPYLKGANVISCLMQMQRHPVTVEGKRTSPVVWDCNCLEGVCGSCAMNINGRVRLACEALVDRLEHPIRLEPMRKFPLVRDLTVNRDRMFEALKQVKGWIPIDGTHNLGPGPRQSPAVQEDRYTLSTCISCGSCLEACPQVSVDNHFLGAAA